MRIAILFLVLSLAMGAASPAPGQPLQAWRYLQALQNLQDRIVHGDEKAYRGQARLLAHIGKVYASLPEETWKNRRDAQALLVYVLSGGNPAVALRLLKGKKPVNLPKGALEGAVAYAEGRNGQAWAHLKAVDDKALTIAARAQLALVKAFLRAAAKPERALQLLDRVRLLKPGTLLEEAALRRALVLSGNEADVPAFMRYAKNYIRHFRPSEYMPDFLRRYAWFLVHLDFGPKPHLITRMERDIALLEPRRQALLYAAVTREALIGGKTALAELAGKKALSFNPGSARFKARLHAWIAAARIAGPDPVSAMASLRAISPAALDESGKRLRMAALVLGRAIIEEPVAKTPAGKPGASSNVDDLPAAVRARAAIAGITRLLKDHDQ